MINILSYSKMKKENQKITMVTCYDAWSAKLLCETDVDMLLVGDSAAMVMHGYDSTLPATIEMMQMHVSAVARGVTNFQISLGQSPSGAVKKTWKEKHIIGDMPFLSFRTTIQEGVLAAGKLMQAGAHSIKLEGSDGNLELVKHLVESGIPVMGHLGLTPQSIHQLGGFKVQGKEVSQQQKIKEDALKLQEAGCYALVLECVPSQLAAEITKSLHIPTIGIGAGVSCDGQVLVLHDLLGLNGDFRPKFLRTFGQGKNFFESAINGYCAEVKAQTYPSEKESYS